MNIIIDAMGGDNAPLEIVRGAAEAAKVYNARIILTGDKKTIEDCARRNSIPLSALEIAQADSVITMDDDPMCVMREKKNSSMSVGLHLLKEHGDAFVSAGNTGALHAGSSLIIRPIKGIRRSCIATVLPFHAPLLLLDCGANINVTPEYMEQWAYMGSVYMKKIYAIQNPKVGLLNNGTEEKKGTQLAVDTHALLSSSNAINFIGNIESKELPFSPCDIVVTDGFTGNIVLKFTEGMGKFMLSILKDLFMKNAVTKMSFLAMKDQVKSLRNDFDASEHGGAPLLGLNKPVIKAHGSSDAKAIRNAVRQAIAYVETGITDEIKESAKGYIKTVAEHDDNE